MIFLKKNIVNTAVYTVSDIETNSSEYYYLYLKNQMTNVIKEYIIYDVSNWGERYNMSQIILGDIDDYEEAEPGDDYMIIEDDDDLPITLIFGLSNGFYWYEIKSEDKEETLENGKLLIEFDPSSLTKYEPTKKINTYEPTRK